jgi:anti-sigma-K factor RskA
MNANRHIEPEDLALFAMQLVSKEESAEITAHLEQCTECLHQLAEIQGDLAIYAHTVDMHSPPALARERLLKQVAREKKTLPIDRTNRIPDRDRIGERPPAREPDLHASPYPNEGYVRQGSRGLGSGAYLTEDDQPKPSLAARVIPWIGWAIAAVLAVAAGNLYHQRDALKDTLTAQSTQLDHVSAEAASARQVLDAMTDTSAMRVTLNKAETAPVPQGKVTYVADKGSLIFIASNMEPLESHKVYELWLIPADGHDPIPAGTFHPDQGGSANLILPPLPKGIAAKAFGITIEDEGGATTPTMPIIMAGKPS